MNLTPTKTDAGSLSFPEESKAWSDAEKNQFYFDETLKNLMTRTYGRSMADDVGCAYVSGDQACAVGLWIEPEYHEWPDVQSNIGVMELPYENFEGMAWPDTDDGQRLASKLQTLHDDGLNWDGGKLNTCGIERAKAFAESWGLEWRFDN